MSLLKRVRVLGAKIETTPGTAETIASGDAAFNVYDVECQSTMSMGERMQQGGFGMLSTPVEGHSGTVTFKLNPYGDGAGGAPEWATTFLPACGLVNSGGVFSPTAEAPGANVKTLTISVYENGLVKQLVGAAGDINVTFPTGKMCEMEFTFTGVWQDVVDGAILSPTYPATLPFRATGGFTIGAWTPCFETLGLTVGNNVVLRECQATDAGYKSAVVTDRQTTGNINPEAALVATNDTYTDWINSVPKALNFEMDNGTDVLELDIAAVQITNVQEGERNMIQTDDIEFKVLDDDFTLTFSASV